MKFFIKRSAYFLRDEKEGAFTVMALKTNQVMYFNRSSRVLFAQTDVWVDLEDLISSLGVGKELYERVCADYRQIGRAHV